MIEHGLGVTTTRAYEIKEVSKEFFIEGGIPNGKWQIPD